MCFNHQTLNLASLVIQQRVLYAMSRHKFVYMVLVDAKFRNALFSCSATYLTKFFTDLFNFSRVPDKLRPNKNDESLSCLDPSSVDQDIPKVNSHHPIFYGAPIVPSVHFFVHISPNRVCAVTMCCFRRVENRLETRSASLLSSIP